MRVIHAPRASAILYQLLAGRKRRHPWLMPANICPIVPETFINAGVPFEFVDISETTLHMDLDQAADRMTRRQIAGVLYAHTYGEASTPNSFFSFARSLHPEILTVDDRCLCRPEFEVSSTADVVLFSTGYAKIVDLNFGGYAFVQNNVRLSKMNAANAEVPDWGSYRTQIKAKLASSLSQRAMLNEIYRSCLPAEIQLPAAFQQWRFNIRVRNKFEVMREIFNNGLFASSHYAALGRAPQAQALASEVINLFNDHHFDAQKAERVCEIVLKQA
jgi:dTDP-4-amino-4,6-dideoxygalactose transaminase